MELRLESHQTVDIIAVSGRLDLVSSSALKDMIRQRLADRRVNLVIDMEKVHFINSSGLGALISCLRDVRLSGGRLTLCRLTPYIEEIFALTNLVRVFDCYPGVTEALDSYDHGPRAAALRG
jgi:anti-sigma B factor antagonist